MSQTSESPNNTTPLRSVEFINYYATTMNASQSGISTYKKNTPVPEEEKTYLTREEIINEMDRTNKIFNDKIIKLNKRMFAKFHNPFSDTDLSASSPASKPKVNTAIKLKHRDISDGAIKNKTFEPVFNILSQTEVFDTISLNTDNDDIILLLLNKLSCADKDERMGTFNINNLQKPDIDHLANNIIRLIKIAKYLIDAVDADSGILNEVSEVNKLNFAMHVMAKGSQMYYACLADTTFCLYLLSPDKYQPVFSKLIENQTILNALQTAFNLDN